METHSVTKLMIPVGGALAIGWILSQLVYGAGSKVTAAESSNEYLRTELAHVSTELASLKADQGRDHDAETRLEVRIEGLTRDWESMQKDLQLRQPIEFSVKGGNK